MRRHGIVSLKCAEPGDAHDVSGIIRVNYTHSMDTYKRLRSIECNRNKARSKLPAAMKTAHFTRYGSSASIPSDVIMESFTNPCSTSSFNTRFTVPKL